MQAVVETGGGDDEVVEQEVDWDLQRVVHVASGKVGTVRTRTGLGDAAMVANKLVVIFDDGRGEHVVVKPDEIATAVKVLTKEEDITPQERRASKLMRAARGVLLGRITLEAFDAKCPAVIVTNSVDRSLARRTIAVRVRQLCHPAFAVRLAMPTPRPDAREGTGPTMAHCRPLRPLRSHCEQTREWGVERDDLQI